MVLIIRSIIIQTWRTVQIRWGLGHGFKRLQLWTVLSPIFITHQTIAKNIKDVGTTSSTFHFTFQLGVSRKRPPTRTYHSSVFGLEERWNQFTQQSLRWCMRTCGCWIWAEQLVDIRCITFPSLYDWPCALTIIPYSGLVSTLLYEGQACIVLL